MTFDMKTTALKVCGFFLLFLKSQHTSAVLNQPLNHPMKLQTLYKMANDTRVVF